MRSIDKKAWLDKHGYARFESKNADTGVITVQWSIYFKSTLYTGKGTSRYEAYANLFDMVRDIMYNLCVYDLDG